MASEKETGIIIKEMDYDLSDKIVTMLTNDEIISFIALGVRKLKSKNRVALQLGNIVEVEIFRARLKGKLSKLKRATLLRQPPLTKSDTASVILEMIKMFKNIKKPSSRLFRAYLEGFKDMGCASYNHHFKVYVLTRLLDTIGVWPKWNKCVECGRRDMINGFEFYKGGFTCNLHSNKKRSVNELKALNYLGNSFKRYKEIDPEINFNLYDELKAILKENGY